jgi:hypothetical protein
MEQSDQLDTGRVITQAHQGDHAEHLSVIDPSVEPSPAPQGGAPSAPAKKRPHPVTDPEIREAVKHWADLFEAQRGAAPYIDWPRFCGQLASVVRARGLEPTKALLDKFFTSDDRIICRSDYTLGAFLGNVNKLIGRAPVVATGEGKTSMMLRGLAEWGEERNGRHGPGARLSAGVREAPHGLSTERSE